MDEGRHDMRIASIKETGEEVSQEEWERFDAAVAEIRAQRRRDPADPWSDPAHPGLRIEPALAREEPSDGRG